MALDTIVLGTNWHKGILSITGIYKWKNFCEMKADVGMSLHEKERDAYTNTQSHS